MALLSPAFLWISLLAGPILLLYMLRLRRRDVRVSSTMLWQRLLRDKEANSPWQRLRRNLLLILQLLILALLVLALARPFLPVPTIASGNVVVLLDASASMQATDVTPNRFEIARERIEEIVSSLAGGDQMTIIQVGTSPKTLISASNDRSALRQAVADAVVSQGLADWQAALALAAGAAQGYSDARIVIVSDGGLPVTLPFLPVEVVYVPIGSQAENLGIAALATRDTDKGPELFARVTNYGRQRQSSLMSLLLDGVLFDSRRLDIPAASSTSLTWLLPDGARTIQTILGELGEDYLALDNTAYAVHQGGILNRTMLVTGGNIFLEQVLSVLPGVNSFKAGPEVDIGLASSEPFELYVFDSLPLPPQLPDGDILIINPSESREEFFTVGGTFSNTATIRVADSPILQFVEWSNVHIRQARQVSSPWMQPLVEGEGGPLILAGERNGRRMAVLTFDLHDSDLPLQIAFPIVMANLTDWLSPGRVFASAADLRPGDVLPLTPGASTTSILVSDPSGISHRLDLAEGGLSFADTDTIGLYELFVQDNSGTRPAGAFVVNLFSAQESRIAPVSELAMGAVNGNAISGEENVGQRELWPLLAALGLLVLMVEWWVHHQGARLPSMSVRLLANRLVRTSDRAKP